MGWIRKADCVSPGKSVGSRGEYRWEGDLESAMEGFLEEVAFHLSAETSSGREAILLVREPNLQMSKGERARLWTENRPGWLNTIPSREHVSQGAQECVGRSCRALWVQATEFRGERQRLSGHLGVGDVGWELFCHPWSPHHQCYFSHPPTHSKKKHHLPDDCKVTAHKCYDSSDVCKHILKCSRFNL